MKKLLAAGILFLAGNCFASESESTLYFQLQRLRLLALEKAAGDVPSYLCVKALKDGKSNIAEYIGTIFLGETWQNCEQYCAAMDRLEKPEIVKLLDRENVPLIRAIIIERAAKDSRVDVIQFISANPNL